MGPCSTKSIEMNPIIAHNGLLILKAQLSQQIFYSREPTLHPISTPMSPGHLMEGALKIFSYMNINVIFKMDMFLDLNK